MRNIGCTKINDVAKIRLGRLIDLYVDSDSFFYECKRFKDYSEAIRKVREFDTIKGIYPLVLLIHANKAECSRRDYYYHLETLRDMVNVADGVDTFCYLLCDEGSPFNDVWGT